MRSITIVISGKQIVSIRLRREPITGVSYRVDAAANGSE